MEEQEHQSGNKSKAVRITCPVNDALQCRAVAIINYCACNRCRRVYMYNNNNNNNNNANICIARLKQNSSGALRYKAPDGSSFGTKNACVPELQ